MRILLQLHQHTAHTRTPIGMGNIGTVAQHGIELHTLSHTHTTVPYMWKPIASVYHHSFVPILCWSEWGRNSEWTEWKWTQHRGKNQPNHNGKAVLRTPFCTAKCSEFTSPNLQSATALYTFIPFYVPLLITTPCVTFDLFSHVRTAFTSTHINWSTITHMHIVDIQRKSSIRSMGISGAHFIVQ